VDDSADEAVSVTEAKRALDELEAMLKRRVDPSPLVSAYLALAERRGFGLDPAFGLLQGVRSDLGRVRVESDEELLTYCHRVAGTVGLMMSGILGATSATALGHAADLGIAMQLTNICRDVLEDAQLGRVYLPRCRLNEAGIESEDLVSGRAPREPKLRRSVAVVVCDLLEMADSYYARGRAGFRFLPVRARLAIAVAAALYQGIGHRLRDRHGSDALGGRTQLPPPIKARICLTATAGWLTTLGSTGWPAR
jgi:phytoene synthase